MPAMPVTAVQAVSTLAACWVLDTDSHEALLQSADTGTGGCLRCAG